MATQNLNGPNAGGNASALNVTAATVIKATPGILFRVVVNTAGAAGAVYDNNATSGNTAANLIATIPATVGVIELMFPCQVGIVYVPGAAQVASISYS